MRARGFILIAGVFLVSTVNASVPDGTPSLDRSLRAEARMGRVSELKKLLQQGANLNGVTDYGQTALHYSVLYGRIPASLWLIRSGARVNTEDDAGRSPLTKAAEDCNDPVVRALLQAGADVNHADYLGKTALMYAADAFCIRSAAILLTQAKMPVNFDARDSSNLSAGDYAAWMAEMIERAREKANRIH